MGKPAGDSPCLGYTGVGEPVPPGEVRAGGGAGGGVMGVLQEAFLTQMCGRGYLPIAILRTSN